MQQILIPFGLSYSPEVLLVLSFGITALALLAWIFKAGRPALPLSEAEVHAAATGPEEEDLVNSGLEETMVTSYAKIRETRRRLGEKPDLRTAAFVVAIEMICGTYGDMGIFP